MKVSDYLVKLLEENDITDIFGIPGVGCGHFMNSMIDSKITSHLTYHEQGAAFAACGYAQASHKIGMAYTTAGPGGTNLVTGIANAYADSIPTIFMVGEKDLAELKGGLNVRQKASQEVDITDVCRPITKWSYQIRKKEEVRYVFEKAFYIAKSERPGPVLIDMPSDIAREELDIELQEGFHPKKNPVQNKYLSLIITELERSKKPLILAGNAMKQEQLEESLTELTQKLNIPIVSTLVAFDCFTGVHNYLGYIGMDGDPVANKAVRECDLLITMGARLNFKQIGYKRDKFAPQARIIRIDADQAELDYKLGREMAVCADVRDILSYLWSNVSSLKKFDESWMDWCIEERKISNKAGSLNPIGDQFMSAIAETFPKNMPIAVDTGSHRRWLMSQIKFKEGQRVYQSAGLASMGYALPASIGIYYASHSPVICVDGDGGIMMNLQEMQLIKRENIPVVLFVFNNHALGDIMEFQKRIFHKNYFTTTEGSGYQAADYEGIAKAFGFAYTKIQTMEDVKKISYDFNGPQLVEVLLPSNE
ncbi:MAG: thiamine pyrophosphate-binding protein [Lachnospiraceae bacterium]|nr:thiamine pyrophosphate-binding protein [Lachnospiraceae bacterium]